MKSKIKFWMLFIIAIALGMLIGFIDSRPHWDDTGITVGMILITSAFLGFVRPQRVWIWALSVGIWIPVWNMLQNNNYSSFIALPIAFVGAYIGVLVYKLFFNTSD
jgi:hypothetical protein